MNNIIPYVISGLALILSIITYFQNYLRPFSPKVLHDSPTLTLYKITPDISGNKEGKTWWIPSLDIDFVFHNTGKISGQIDNIRLIARKKENDIETEFLFYPKWIVDFKVFNEYKLKRFEWIKKSVIRDWYPILINSNSEVNIHLILEGFRWETEWEGKLLFELEILTSKSKKWQKYNKYEYPIREHMFKEKATYILRELK